MPSSADRQLEIFIRARYPVVYVISWEERRVEDAIRAIARERTKVVHTWTITQGFTTSADRRDAATRDPLAALDYIARSPEHAIFVLKDFHAFISDANVTRRLRDVSAIVKNCYKTIIVVSPILKLPPELEKDITVLDYGLPSYDELSALLDQTIRSVREMPSLDTNLTPEERERVLKATQGLTSTEAENVLAKSLVEKHRFDVDVVLSEKEQIIRKSGILEYYPANEAFADVGGLNLLKGWMEKRTTAFTDRAREFGLPEPKGVLLIGVQGCGKSLTAKAIGAQWRLPLLRLDIGKVFAGLVGASEENMRKAIRVAESVAPCILWLDELEKGLSGTQSSGSSDGGTTSRVFSTFLTWLQEKTVPVFVVSTANQVEALPPELLRKGRFDEIFFIDLPAANERAEIFEIHLRRRKRDASKYDTKELARITPGFSGAEIEQLVVESLYDAFDTGRDITMDDIRKAARATVPLSMTMREKIGDLREWASSRARMASDAAVETLEQQSAALAALKASAPAKAAPRRRLGRPSTPPVEEAVSVEAPAQEVRQ